MTFGLGVGFLWIQVCILFFLFAMVVLGLVSSVLSQEFGWEERL